MFPCRLILALALMVIGSFCGLSSRLSAQGEIAFRNIVRGLSDAPVFDTDCQTRLKGSAYLSEVYAGLSPDSLQPADGPIPFLATGIGGYMEQAGGAVIAGAGDGTVVYAQLRAWEAAAGPSYEAAVAAGGKYGESNIVPMVARVPPGPPDWPVGLQSFCLIPEPSPLALLACAGGIGLISAWRSRRTTGGGSFRHLEERR
jgi:hypothetical protein